jgi:hypothetical protein
MTGHGTCVRLLTQGNGGASELVFIRGLIRSIILYQLPDHGPGNRHETIDLGLKKLIFALKLLIMPKIGRTTQSRLTFLSLNPIRVMIFESTRIDWEPLV